MAKYVKHIVFQRFNDKEDAKTARDMLIKLPEAIPQLLSMEVGLDITGSERSYDLALTAVFKTVEDMKLYEKHPAHMAVREFIRPRRSATASVDYFFDKEEE